MPSSCQKQQLDRMGCCKAHSLDVPQQGEQGCHPSECQHFKLESISVKVAERSASSKPAPAPRTQTQFEEDEERVLLQVREDDDD
eukprot:1141245-Pelagomonas_calceolata.AAC.10